MTSNGNRTRVYSERPACGDTRCCAVCGKPFDDAPRRCPECESKLIGSEADDEDSYGAQRDVEQLRDFAAGVIDIHHQLADELHAERKLRHRLQEWLMGEAKTDRRDLHEFTLTAVATELRRLEHELLGE